ncbi:MAG: hydroxymethylglutaryl-CoA lyase, partial [Chromatiales bacterium]|nr:hydroxymethylglutaryl-CoA lyase [Chromatiales bacterium]
MDDIPHKVQINEEGPREGFQIEPGPIPTERKIELIDALSETGLNKIQVASFVNPKRVPGWADADAVVEGFKRAPGVKYDVLWLNEKGLHRALRHEGLSLRGSVSTTASEAFMRNNTNRGYEENARVQRNQIDLYLEAGLPVTRASVMTAFGCNFEGDVPTEKVIQVLEELMTITAEAGVQIEVISLAD